MILRRTKIIATLGPATDNHESLTKLLVSGVDVVRLNFSHGTLDEHRTRANWVREIAKKMGKEIGILADLQGPKIRIARFKQGKVLLKEGQPFLLDASLEDDVGNDQSVGIDYKNLPHDVKSEDTLLLDDGRIVMKVNQVEGTRIHCRVEVGGVLSNNKGVNRQGGGLSAQALTEKDRVDLQAALELNVDYIAVSFPRSAEDIQEARELINQAGGRVGIIAKIERAEAVNNLEEIIAVSEGIMIARGDLGVEIGDAELPAAQKQAINMARAMDKIVITATQMMESMITNSIPTRAEVFDVANAVLDGTDAVMLSEETAVGKHPDKVVAAMARVCVGAEKHPRARTSRHRVEVHFHRVDEAIAMAAMYAANHLDIKGIIALTESGSTPLWMSRIRSGIPIFALTRFVSTQRRMTLMRGVYPIHFDVTKIPRNEINKRAVALLQEMELVKSGDRVIITKGDVMGVHGGANAMKIVTVGEIA